MYGEGQAWSDKAGVPVMQAKSVDGVFNHIAIIIRWFLIEVA